MNRLLFGIISLGLLLVACEDKDAISRDKADKQMERVFPMMKSDADQIRKGLPEGTAILVKHLEEDPGSDPHGLQRAITTARGGVHDLVVAKGNFFVFVDPAGTMLRSEATPDIAAGMSLTKDVPDAKKFLDAKAGLVEVYGYSEGLRWANKGGDLQWIVGHPVVRKDKLLGAFITGWSLRRYADYLEADVRRDLTDAAGGKAIPLVYVFVIKDNTAYGGRITPDVNTEAMTKLEIGDKVKAGDFKTNITLDARTYAVTAKKVEALPGVTLAVMLSEV